jgi:FdhD protein
MSVMNGKSRAIVQNRQSRWVTAGVEAAEERPVSLTVNGEVWLTFMCTPADLDALAVGFLFNEGLIEAPADVAAVRVCPTGQNVDVWLRRAVALPQTWRRTTGCVGGATTVDLGAGPALANDGTRLAAEAVGRLMRVLFAGQQLYREAGGVHCSALSDGERLSVLAEDIGRHNTLDKLAGRCLLERRVMNGSVLLTTGRISSEMAQKAARMGTSIVISRSAASSLAIELAERWGLTLIGYARREQFNLYTHPERLLPPVAVPSTGWPIQPANAEPCHA